MDRSYMINDYVSENDKNLAMRDERSNYLNYLKIYISGSKSLTEIMVHVSEFLDKYNVNDEIKNDLLKICNEFDEKTSLDVAQSRLENYLSKCLEEKEEKYLKSNSELYDVKNDLIDDSKRKLESVGIELNGDNNSTLDSINDVDDVYRIKNNVDTAHDSFYERNKVVNRDEISNVEVSIDSINDVVDSSRSDIILDEALETEKTKLEIENPSMIETNDNGSIQVNGDTNNNDSMNFAAMMTMALLTTLPGNVNYDLNMKLIKDVKDVDKFKIIYGNFPLANHPENKLDPVVTSQIMGLAKTYKSDVNYMELLGKASPELKEAMTFTYENVLGKPGAFQMAIKNSRSNYDMMMGMDKNYSNELTALGDNGATVTHDANEYGMAAIKEHVPGNQLLILSSTNEMLRKEKENGLNSELKNNYQYLKKIENEEAANVNYTFLITVILAEVLLVGSYFIFTFINK